MRRVPRSNSRGAPLGALGRVFRIRPGEGRTVGLVVALMFVATAGLTIGESGVSALFFDRVGADRLPLMYLAQGAVGLLGMLVLTAVLGRFDRRRAYVALPAILAAVVLAERAVAAAEPGWIYAALWLTVTVAILVQAVFLWGAAGLVTDTRRAKRLFPLFGAGGILGAVLGGLATKPLAAAIGAQNLLVVWAVGLAGTAALCATVLGVRRRPAGPGRPRGRRATPVAELRQGLSYVRRSPLLRWLTVAAILFSVLYYSLYLPYAQAASARLPDPDDLAGFFGIFWASVTAAAFLVSMLVTNRLLGWFGATAMVLVLPLLYAGAFGTLLATSTFGTLVAIRFTVNVWLQGVSSASWETLVNVVPEDRRDQMRAFLNGGPSQAGTAIAGVVQLVGQQLLSATQLTIIGLVAAVVTLAVTWRIRRAYTSALVDALRAGRPRVFEDVAPGAPIALHQDAQATELAVKAMEDRDHRVRRLAVTMLDPAADGRAAVALARALEDEDPLVRANAIEVAGRAVNPEPRVFERALRDDDPSVRLAAVLALRGSSRGPAIPASLLSDPTPAVAAAAAVHMLEGRTRREAADALRRLLSDADPSVRVETLNHLRSAAPEDAADLASALVTDPSPAVRAAALRVLVAASPRAAIGAALDGLASDDPTIRPASFAALSVADLRGLETAVRRSAHGWTALAEADRAASASIVVDGDASELLRDALTARGRTRAVAALSALALLSDDRDAARAALDSLDAWDPHQRANALETLEVAVGTAARPLLALWEPGSGTGRSPSIDLGHLLEDDDPLIRACADHVRAHRDQGADPMTRSRTSMSQVERILVLRRIPLFAELSPFELQRIADVAEEHAFADGDVIAAEGEIGEELHIVVSGTVRVARADGETIARRGPGDVVGEMSIITRSPRVASLIAGGEVRTVRLGSREFESMIRERPDVALAVMRVLAGRIGESSTG